ncbi:helix-turn-helix domain-containing protein [Paenibacillus arenilitoris]|uniref:Helix-turn-helix transcriptional regulator n=1 Tax=Paenibacillus arenilitoris TaxID=2772299 RepID=A0A927CK23_9BACL|nr:AraC family transcriptional regulator [Paenibacillus arenilitoris]MBD2868587.1 helix-turn-helix transcriptional regulator [Paenibacillus arenilitoris]
MAAFDRVEFGHHSFFCTHKLMSEGAHWFHAHRGIEMLYIYEGEGEAMLEGKSYPLSGGTLIWVQPYQLHLVDVPSGPASVYVRTNLTFDPHLPAAYLTPFPGLRRFYERLWKGNLPIQVFSIRDAEDELSAILLDMHRLRGEPSEEREEGFGLHMLRLLQFLQRRVFPESPPGSQANPRALKHVENITDWLETNYKRPFRLEELASDLFLSPYHLSHVFKACTGISLSDHLTFRRIREACKLLANTSMPVREIAREVGGLSPAYFCQMFKKNKGVTPENYRKAIRSRQETNEEEN